MQPSLGRTGRNLGDSKYGNIKLPTPPLAKHRHRRAQAKKGSSHLMKHKAELFAEAFKLDARKIFCEHIGGVLLAGYEE